MNAFNFKEVENLKKQIALMSKADFNRWVTSIYESGFNDAKKQMGLSDDTEAFIWDEDALMKLFKQNYISDRLSKELIRQLEE